MKYIILPNSVPELLKEQNEEFIQLQNVYRKKLEEYLNKYVDFHNIDLRIKAVLNVPILSDSDYNFYHKYSSLNSYYIYLRNNIHVERLSDEDKSKLKKDEIDEDFVIRNLPTVLFEEGDLSFFGTPVMDYLAPSKSIVFEFAYNQALLTQIQDIEVIRKAFSEISSYLKSTLEPVFKQSVSTILYDGIPDIYKTDWELESNQKMEEHIFANPFN